MSHQCPSVKFFQQQLCEMVKSASSAPTPVNHRSAPIPVAHASKTSFADVVKQSIQEYHLSYVVGAPLHLYGFILGLLPYPLSEETNSTRQPVNLE